MALLNLEELGARLGTLDRLIMLLAKRRMDYALQVGKYKLEHDQPIYREDKETERIESIRAYAGKHGLNQHFAAELLYALINESCKQQMIQLQTPAADEPQDEDERYRRLKQQLLALTERVCRKYNDGYSSEHFATQAYLEYEAERMAKEIDHLEDRELAVDIGCGTGKTSFRIADAFARTVGYDLSQHMIATAEELAEKKYGRLATTVAFVQHDVETDGIPLPDSSASFVVMSLGTASDMRDFTFVLAEIDRVLKPGGRFFLSFYNAEALLYRWDLLPWPTSLAAHVNIANQCLDVEVGADESGDDEHPEGAVYSIYARPYKSSEVADQLSRIGEFLLETYPTISPLLPDDLFRDQPEIQAHITAIDQTLVPSALGAYIVATGQKA